MKPWRLTQQAESSLRDIAIWTVKHFGNQQAIKYRDELIDCINRLASSNPPQSKSCGKLLQETHNELFYIKKGSHFIVFRETEKQLEILEFFHQHMDLPTHITRLTQNLKE